MRLILLNKIIRLQHTANTRLPSKLGKHLIGDNQYRYQQTNTNSNEVAKTTAAEKKNDETDIERIQKELLNKQKLALDMEQELNRNKTIIEIMPKPLQPYLHLMRLDKPIGTLLVYYPCIWSALGITSLYINEISLIQTATVLGIFGLGAVTMRSAGCIINDLWDKKYDKSVERCKDRPLASGQLSTFNGLSLLGVNLGISLYLLFQLNLPTQLLGVCGLLPTILYPVTKRFSRIPQFYLGLCINWGLLMAWSQLLPTVQQDTTSILSFIPSLVLYAACIPWTMYYDTIYANQDKKDDLKLGLNSTAITFEKRQKLWLLLFSTLTTTNLCAYGYLTHQEPIYYAFMSLVYGLFLKQILFLNLNSTQSCNTSFKSNSTIGLLTALGLLGSLYVKLN